MEKERVEENKTQNVRSSKNISGDPPPLPLLPSHALIFVRAELDNKALQQLSYKIDSNELSLFLLYVVITSWRAIKRDCY